MTLAVASTSRARASHRGARWAALTLTSCLTLSLGLVFGGCGGSALTGSVDGLEIQVQDGFYVPLNVDGNTYAYFILSDLADICSLFSQEEDLGANYHVFVGSTSALQPGEYPLYSPDQWGGLEGNYANASYAVRINGTDVLEESAVAGSIEITNVDLNGKVLSGVVDAIFGGQGNVLQGSFQLAECTELAE